MKYPNLFIILFLVAGVTVKTHSQTFEKLPLSLFGSGPVQCGDYNSDGKMDLIIQGRGAAWTHLLKNDGDFKFTDADLPHLYTNKGILGNGYNASKFADFDNDGLVDIVCNGVGFLGTGTLFFLFNNGNGTFTSVALTDAGRSYGSTEIVDFNNDGFLDVYTNGGLRANSGGDDGGAELIKNLGNRTFAVSILSQIPNGTYQSARCVDIDKDGLVDIVQNTDTGIKLFINHGNFNFIETTLQGITKLRNMESKSLLIEDFNNDGQLEIVSYYDSNLDDAIHFKQVDGSYLAQKLFPNEITDYARYMVAGDINNDGNLDICGQIGLNIYVFYNDGNGSFKSYEIIETNNNSAQFWFNYSIALADLDNDGDLDIAASNTYMVDGAFTPETRIYKNNSQIVNRPPAWNAIMKVVVNNNDVLFNWKPASDDHTSRKSFKYILFIGKWDEVNNKVSQIISPSNVLHNSIGLPEGPSLIAYPDMASVDTFAIRKLDMGKYVAAAIQIDQSYKVGSYSVELFNISSSLCLAPVPKISNDTVIGGGSVTLTPSGGTNYYWYNVAYGGTPISIGPSFTTPYLESTTNYYVANNDGSCESERVQVTVTILPTPLSFSLQPTDNLATLNSNITFETGANKPDVNYQWQSNPCKIGWQNISDNSTYQGANTAKLTINKIQIENNLQPFRVIISKNAEIDTSKVVYIKVADTCFLSVVDTLIIEARLITQTDPNTVNIIKVFPNPAKDHITINYGNYLLLNGYSIVVYNSTGQTVYSNPITQKTSYIDLSTWNGAGLYLLYLLDNAGKTIDIKKIMLQ